MPGEPCQPAWISRRTIWQQYETMIKDAARPVDPAAVPTERSGERCRAVGEGDRRSSREDGRLRITFHGAARQVTGSAHLLEIGDRRILLDCGLFDSNRIDPDSPNRQFTFDPRDLDAVIVSHAHNDHIGRLPCLVRAGYKGPIYATPATGDILSVMLRDSARIQREDAAQRARSRTPNDQPIEPLFELADVEWVVEQLQPAPLRRRRPRSSRGSP